MAHIVCNFFSQSLNRNVDITVLIPSDKTEKPQKFKTLYLLHGIFGSHCDWSLSTRIDRWAKDRNLVVVMPSGENRFYVDHKESGNNFSQFVGKELVDFTRRTFPLSTKREDTFIGGLSMGGYGALVNGLKYNETFGSIIALSSALILDLIVRSTDNPSLPLHRRKSFYESIFGDLSKLKGSDKDYKALIDSVDNIPSIYMACGQDDHLLYKANVRFHEYLVKQNIHHTFETGPGGHDWDFWDTFILKASNWLPLEEETKGRSSGNMNYPT